jgi:hypothetical protein
MAEIGDLSAVKEIADEFRDELGFVYEAELIRGVQDRSVIVAEVDGQVVGFNYFSLPKGQESGDLRYCCDWTVSAAWNRKVVA